MYDHDPDCTYGRRAFARPGSALRAEYRNNLRIHPCPTCGAENVLTRADVRLGYQCDRCADADEGISAAY